MLFVSGWSRIVPQCGQKAGPLVVDVAAKKLILDAQICELPASQQLRADSRSLDPQKTVNNMR